MPLQKGQTFLYHSSLPTKEVALGVTRQILGYDASIMTVKVVFKKGSIGELHHHPHTQTSYIASGSFDVSIDGESQILSAGDSFYVAPDLVHGVVCMEEGILIDSFSPCREDFL
ncbi:MAG: Cupin 2 conserved barrel domain protein [Daejeonella sp.]|nr:Cupin 2 conserved barrel domain protein [Daejeonella sp.]